MKIVALTAPSGAGKTTIARRLTEAVPQTRFSVSATTRAPRERERDGVDYFFLTEDEFRRRVEAGDFIEFETYAGHLYGTLRSELERVAAEGVALLDIDVRGALNVKRLYDADALTLFIQPPSLAALAERLKNRKTESEITLRMRLERAEQEMMYAADFDAIVVNDDLETAVVETVDRVRTFLGG
ncbi:MAG: guanylate kinase [Rhodothermales bacterium]